MNKQDKVVIKVVIVWCLFGLLLVIFMPDKDNKEGDSGIKGYPQEFYDTTK